MLLSVISDDIALNVIILDVIVLGAIMLCVIMLGVVVLNVVAPKNLIANQGVNKIGLESYSFLRRIVAT